MEPDFSGYATKAGLKCSDGRTIMPEAFQHQDKMQVPLVWQHGHNDPTNIVGHAILHARPDGVWADAYFNKTEKAKHLREAILHGDIKMMSIYANELIEKSSRVLHGVIREVSLVLSGANPGALIEKVTITHGNGTDIELEDEAVIYSGEEITHGAPAAELEEDESKVEETDGELIHEEATDDSSDDDSEDELTIQEVYDSMNDEQKTVVHYFISEALEQAAKAEDDSAEADDDKEDTASHSDESEEGTIMAHNVFESDATDTTPESPVLSHEDVKGIMSDALRTGRLSSAVEGFALQHGIENIEVLFPEAQTLGATPEWDKRRTEWVNTVLSGVSKSPFARIKTISADITMDQARAKGYITGNMKKEEFFPVTKRTTEPTTIYKKQKLDRDDVIDITDFDVIMWMKGEMRLMLDEELARAVLIGDGRDPGDDDKIPEDKIRPIASDHELYTTVVNVNIEDADSSIQEVIDAVVRNRKYFKGTGLPTMFTTETIIAEFLLLKDSLGRRIYKNLGEIASELRVSSIVPVEVMEEDPSIVAVLVNLQDYVIGADKGGQVTMFEDFDIDFNQQKYLLETRVSGALRKLKSAMVVKSVASTLVLATPEEPGFVASTGVVTIPTVTGVVYEDAANPGTPLLAGAQGAILAGASVTIVAVPDTGYYFETSAGDSWTFTRDSA